VEWLAFSAHRRKANCSQKHTKVTKFFWAEACGGTRILDKVEGARQVGVEFNGKERRTESREWELDDVGVFGITVKFSTFGVYPFLTQRRRVAKLATGSNCRAVGVLGMRLAIGWGRLLFQHRGTETQSSEREIMYANALSTCIAADTPTPEVPTDDLLGYVEF
jgi:hypothetical protein